MSEPHQHQSVHLEQAFGFWVFFFFFHFYFAFVSLVSQDRVSLCSSACSGMPSVAQADLELTEICQLGLEALITTAWLLFFGGGVQQTFIDGIQESREGSLSPSCYHGRIYGFLFYVYQCFACMDVCVRVSDLWELKL